MRTPRLVAPFTVAALLGAAATALAPSALAASPAPPPGWLQPLQVTPAAGITTTPETLSGASCPAVIAYVSRGSDERRTTNSQDYANRTKYYAGFGEEMSPLVNYLATMYPGSNQFKAISNDDGDSNGDGVIDQPSNYPALGVDTNLLINGQLPQAFMDSVYNGAQAAIDDLNAIHATCGSSRLVLVGYSQGALVNRLALGSYGTGPAVNGKKLTFEPTAAGKAVNLLFGDPSWGTTRTGAAYGPRYEGDVFRPGAAAAGDEKGIARNIYDTGNSVPRRELLNPSPSGTLWNATSFCHGGDPICQSVHQLGQFGVGFPEHIRYDEWDLLAAATRAAAVLNTATGGYKTAIAVPAILPEAGTDPCLPRGQAIQRSGSMTASAASGATSRTYRSAWVKGGNAGPGGTASGDVTVAPGNSSTITSTSTNNFFFNDSLEIRSSSGIAGAPDLLVYWSRICPA